MQAIRLDKPSPGTHVARLGRCAGAAVAILSFIGLPGCEMISRHYMETKALTTGPNGPETPGTKGIPFERYQIASGSRHLDSYIVRAPASCSHPPVILIYHGVQETISMWPGAQDFLYQNCVSSVVFDYTGSGDSSRPARFESVNEDAVAAYDSVRKTFSDSKVFVLGHSMGNGPMLEAVPQFDSPPSGVIVANAFMSIREFGGRAGRLYALLAKLSPDWWNNLSAVPNVSSPILVVHSDTDTVNPVADGEAIFAAAHEPKSILILHGFAHNDLYRKPTDAWWGKVLDFVRLHNS